MFVAVVFTVSGCANVESNSNPSEPAQSVILFIGDGMGFEQVEAARFYNGAPLIFETFPYQGQINTYSANSEITDSAASATAMATGRKVNDQVLSLQIPGSGEPLTTSLQLAAMQGRSTALVTTTPALHATPAGFAAHVEHRNMESEIRRDYLEHTRPTVVLAGGGMGLRAEHPAQAGYTTVTDRQQMFDAAADAGVEMLFGVFGGGALPYEYDYFSRRNDGFDTLPHLSEMTTAALEVLERNPEGFFMMVEGGIIDWAGHDNKIERNIYETIEFANAVEAALEWAQGRDDVLIVVTSDHETGGLTVLEDKGPGQFPEVSWSTGGHTGAPVPLYCWGKGAEKCYRVNDNTDIFWLTTGITACQVEDWKQQLVTAD